MFARVTLENPLPADRRRLSGPGLRTFLTIADRWGLNEEQRRLVLGDPDPAVYKLWCKRARDHTVLDLGVETLNRISAVLGIYQALEVLFTSEQEGLNWLHSAHTSQPFEGRPPFDLIRSNSLDEMLLLRRFLDGARGGIYMAPNQLDRGFEPYRDDDIEFH